MDFILKKQLVLLLDTAVSLKGKLSIGAHGAGFPKKVASLKEVLLEENQNINYTKAFSEEPIVRILPKTIEPKMHKKFSSILNYMTRERFVLRMRGARVAFTECFVITPKGNVIEEINPLMGRGTSPIFYKSKMPPLRHYSGKVAVISNTNNYFHWMFETIPRILLLKKLKINPDYFVVGANNSFKKESLRKMGLKESKIISASDEMHLFADELIVPSFPINSGNPTPMVCEFLRKTFLKPSVKSLSKKYERVYISRGEAKERKVVNEKEVIDYLSKRGFVSISMDGKSIEEQAKIFSSAKVIVAAHGAALSNLVFCNKGAKVIEVFHPAYVNACFWALSNCMGLNHYYFLGEKTGVFDAALNITLPIDKLGETLSLARVE
ncbi:Uncharacterised protein [uncultured archaeon]|nr:Uncharacterised protein [uncultured archaeon]